MYSTYKINFLGLPKIFICDPILLTDFFCKNIYIFGVWCEGVHCVKWLLPDVFQAGKLHMGVQTGQCSPQWIVVYFQQLRTKNP